MNPPRVKKKYHEPEPGEWVLPTEENYKLGCCDCGLVHRFNFRVREIGGRMRMEYQVFRDNRATAAMRRWRREKGEDE